MNQALRTCLAAVVPLSLLAAQDPEPPSGDETVKALRGEIDAMRGELARLRALVDAGTNDGASAVHGAVSLDVVSAYYFRGILQENAGFIAQPAVELGWTLLAKGGPFRDVDLTFGTWNSLHSGPTGGSDGGWYESDAYARLSTRVLDRLALSTTYSVYHGPNGTFPTVQEQMVSIAFDDSDLWWNGGLQPSVTFAFEIDGQADGGGDEGSYAELGIAPSVPVASFRGCEVELSLPVTLGLGMDDYFEMPPGAGSGNETFGFLDVGLVASCNLPWLPAAAGAWSLALGIHWLHLGDANEAVNGGGGDEWVGTLGVRLEF